MTDSHYNPLTTKNNHDLAPIYFTLYEKLKRLIPDWGMLRKSGILVSHEEGCSGYLEVCGSFFYGTISLMLSPIGRNGNYQYCRDEYIEVRMYSMTKAAEALTREEDSEYILLNGHQKSTDYPQEKRNINEKLDRWLTDYLANGCQLKIPTRPIKVEIDYY